MRGQYYGVKVAVSEKLSPGQLVFTGHDYDDTVIGFVYKVENERAEIVLSSPRKLPHGAHLIAETVNFTDLLRMLDIALSKTPDMIAEWRGILNEWTSTVH